MFDIHDGLEAKGIRRIAAGLALLSLMALAVTGWILANVQHEQEIIQRLVKHLPPSDLAAVDELYGDLTLQTALSFLLVLNIIATAITFGLVVRGYLSSERSLRDVKVLATDILASMDAGVITTDDQGVVTSINPSARQLVALPDAAVGRPLAEIAPQHRLLADMCDEIREHHRPIRDRDYCVTAAGHKTTLRAGCTLLYSRRQQRIGMVIQVRDVTERALIEQRLRRMERYMGLGALAAGLQHEIKNPLSALSLHIQLLGERLESDAGAADVDETLEVLHTEVRRINDVLDGFRNYASLTDLGKAPVDLTGLVEKLVRLLRPQAERQGVRIAVDVGEDAAPRVHADSVQIEQVLLNLALNAIGAMPEGGELRFRLHIQDGSARIDVIDTGQGIPPQFRSAVFDPYFTTRSDGTGMGLALCDKIVRQHDGSIDFRSDQRGTEFTVLLPLP